MSRAIEFAHADGETRESVIRILAESMAQTLRETQPHDDDSTMALVAVLSDEGYTDQQIKAAGARAVAIFNGADPVAPTCAQRIREARRDARIALAVALIGLVAALLIYTQP